MLRTSAAMVAWLGLVHSVGAQERPEPRMFLPRDYDVVAVVDVDALIESGLYDVLERSVMRPLMESFGRTHGFWLSDLHAFHVARRQVTGENGWPVEQSVMVFEGNEKVGLSKVTLDDPARVFEKAKIGGFEVLTDKGVETWASPRPGSLVAGDAAVVDATLRGEHHGGVPVPDLLALTAVPGGIAYVAGMLGDAFEGPGSLAPIPPHWFDEEDPPHALLLRLDRARESEAAMRLSLLLRFRDGEGGAERFRREFDAWMNELGDDPRLRLLSGTLRKIETSVDHADFVATLDLDQPERVFSIALNAFGSLAFLAFREIQVAAPGPVMVVPVGAEEEGPEEEPEAPDEAPPEKPVEPRDGSAVQR